MQVRLHKKFNKSLGSQPKKIQDKFLKKMRVFVEDQFHPSLKNHALSGDMLGVRSINITGDIRVHYEQVDDCIIFMKIGTHAELY